MKEKFCIMFLMLCPLLFLTFVSLAAANTRPKEEIISMFKELCGTHPCYSSFESIGKSVQGNDIWVFKIGNSRGGRIMVDAQMHGSEDIGSEVTYLFARWLLESGEERAERVLARNYFLFVPVVNIDTYSRQNMRRVYNFGNGTIVNIPYGVNLNRNFPTGWGGIGTSDPNSSDDYRGLYAGSEPETRALHNVFAEYNLRFYVNTHEWGGPLLYYCGANKNGTLTNLVLNAVKNESRILNVSPFPVSAGGGGGFAENDASYFNASSWLIEFNASNNATSETYQTIQSEHYPRAKAIFLAMAGLCEGRPYSVGDVTGGTPDLFGLVPDGKVDCRDVAVVSRCFGSYPGCSPPLVWRLGCDLNNDGRVDAKDIAVVARNFGQTSL